MKDCFRPHGANCLKDGVVVSDVAFHEGSPTHEAPMPGGVKPARASALRACDPTYPPPPVTMMFPKLTLASEHFDWPRRRTKSRSGSAF
jgi:hypothetical protein